MSLTAARMAALRLGYIPDLTSSSSPVKYASGRRTVTSFIHVSPDTWHVNELICNYSLNRVYLGKVRIILKIASRNTCARIIQNTFFISSKERIATSFSSRILSALSKSSTRRTKANFPSIRTADE